MFYTTSIISLPRKREQPCFQYPQPMSINQHMYFSNRVDSSCTSFACKELDPVAQRNRDSIFVKFLWALNVWKFPQPDSALVCLCERGMVTLNIFAPSHCEAWLSLMWSLKLPVRCTGSSRQNHYSNVVSLIPDNLSA